MLLSIAVTCAALVLAVRAVNADTRAQRLGGVAAAFGVGGFAPAILGSALDPRAESWIRIAGGVACIALAAAAVTVATWALKARRSDRSAAAGKPAVGLACGVLNLFCGTGLVVSGAGFLVPSGGPAWVWRSERYGIEVTVPSQRWILKSNPNVVAEFTASRPTVAALVAEVRAAATDAEYDAVLAYGQKARADTPATGTDERTAPNRHGHPHWVYIGDARTGSQPYLFGISVTRVRDRAVVMMFEGPYLLWSAAGHEQERAVLRSQAELFLGSATAASDAGVPAKEKPTGAGAAPPPD